ncbi:MAG: MlaD family protein [Candidatus Binatia bacterium]
MPDSLPPVPDARTVSRRRTRLSLVWVIPILAAVVGAWVAVARILAEGPTISITFQSAEGLEAGKTKIQYNGVDVGTITAIRLSDDHRGVILSAQMAPRTQALLVDDTHFWVVRPRISGANVSGLGTLISGAYLGMEIGHSSTARRDFAGLEKPPVVTSDVPGRYFVLKTPTLGSLDAGTPLFFRRLQVGEVAEYALDPDGQALSIKVFVKDPYDKFVTADTRFWQASGVDVSLNASGLTVQTQSVLSILIGGIAFETPAAGAGAVPAEANTVFPLYDNRTDAFRQPSVDPQTYLLVFSDSVRGLSPGAPVELRGIPIGEVVSVTGQLDPQTFEFNAPVVVRLDPRRLGVKVLEGTRPADVPALRRQVVDALVAHGARAQLRTGSLITGAMFVAFDFFPNAPPATVDWSQDPVRLPTQPGEIQAIEQSVVSIIKKVDQIPFKAIGDDVERLLKKLDGVPYQGIGDDLRKTMAELDQTLDGARAVFDNANRLVAPDSLLGAQLGTTLDEVNRAARGVRVLADYLERHPEALIRGKTGEAQ